VSHLTDAQRDELKAMLEKELTSLRRSMSISEEALKPVKLDQTAVGRLSRMDSLQNQGMTRNLYEREQAKLAKIGAALGRLDAGTFGACTLCGAELPYGRLLVFPEAESCTACE